MRFTLEDIKEAIINRDTGDTPYVALRLGKPWAGIVPHEYVQGLHVVLVMSLEDDQPYLVAGPAYGNVEVELDMQHAYRRQVLAILVEGGVVVQAPYHNCAGSKDMTQLMLSNQSCHDKLTEILRNCRVTLYDGVEILSQGRGVYLLGTGLSRDYWVVDWAVDKLNATVDTSQLKKEINDRSRQLERLQPYADKYLTKGVTDE